MNEQNTTRMLFPGPISPDWTIERLLDWFAEDDDRLSDAALRRPLLAVEEALTGSRWTLVSDAAISGIREPAIISLLRSIALYTGRQPALRVRTIAEILTDCDETGLAVVSTGSASSTLPFGESAS